MVTAYFIYRLCVYWIYIILVNLVYEMQEIFVISLLITALFCLAKFIEFRFFDESAEMKPLKFVARDALLVLVSSMTASFVYFHMDGTISEFLNVITETKALDANATQIFTDKPAF